MKARIAALIFGVAFGLALVFGSGAAQADKPPPIGAHRHYVLVNDSKVYIGPNFCDVDAAAQGFEPFHLKVHVTDPGLVDVLSEGCP